MLTRRGFLQSVFALLLLLVGTLGHGALVERYVSALADGSGAGTTITAPMTWAQMATELTTTTTARAGNRYNIKADGTYSLSASNTFAAPGTPEKPVILRGYKTTPGDGYLGRVNGNGALVATNMPMVAYGIGCGVTLATHNIFESLNFTGNINGILVSMTGNTTVFCCAAFNSANNASASCFSRSSADTMEMINCDGTLSGASSAGYVFSGGGAGSVRIIKCQARNMAAVAGGCFQTNGSGVIIDCIAYPSAGVGINFLASPNTAVGNTIYSQAIAGIRTPNSGQTNHDVIIGNTITDCGRALLNQYNATAAHPVLSAFNRTRDNTNADLGFGDWPYFNHVTTDTGGPESDYVDATNGDLRLIQASPAYGTAPGGGNIGAAQNRYGGAATIQQRPWRFGN